VQYFFVTYPLKDPAGNSVAGAAPDPTDDLWLNYDFWAKAQEGMTPRRVSKTNKVTMRNEISAMANKIWPNTSSKVPARYLDAIEQSLGWRPDTTNPQAGSTARMEGIWYDLGNVGAGFDNDGDGLPDRNAWMQPVGDPATYDPLCLRLVKCYGLVVIKLNDGSEKLIPFEDRLYFDNIPGNNTGAVGLVFYEFMPLEVGCSVSLSPYQEVASGHDNEKFNGDYGAATLGFTAAPPAVDFTKSGPALVAGGGTASYSLTASNTGTKGIGLPGLSLPFVFEDAIPAGLVYVAGSGTAANTIPGGNGVVVNWSVDEGVSWVTTEPVAASVTRVRWTLSSALAAGTTAVVGFQAVVPTNYPSVTVDNTGVIKLGSTGSLGSSTVTSRLTGLNSVGDLVWRDDNRDSLKGAGEPGISNVTVRLYHDTNSNGALDAGEPLFGTTQTDGSGIYGFANLPDGRYLVEVDVLDDDLPAGSTLPNSVGERIAVDLDVARVISSAVSVLTADWPLIDALSVSKTTTPTIYGAGSLVTYSIDLENHAAAVAAKTLPVRTGWATMVTGTRPVQNPANAEGGPDSSYARVDFQGNSDTLTTGGGFTYESPTGTITKVELVFNAYLSQALANDQMDVRVSGSLFTTLTTAQLNTLLGPAQVYAVDATSLNANWSWTQVQALTAELKASKMGQADTGIVWVDSLGYRVTTVAVTPPAGSYGVATPPGGYAPSYDEDGTGTAHVSGVSLNGGAQYLTADFGYAPLLADISGQVRYDGDEDGDFNDADSGAMAVKIQLWSDPNGDGDPSDGVQEGEVYTDVNGDYLFAEIPSGNHVVVEINPPGTTSTGDVGGANDDRIPVVLMGINVTGRDFLDTQPPVYAVSGTVYVDRIDDNVIGAGDAPLGLVTVRLYFDRDRDGVVGAGDSLLATALTNSGGGYTFAGLPAGYYVVEEVDPSGATSEWDAQGSPTDNQIGVTVVNADVTDRDFLDDGVAVSAVSGQVTNGVFPIPGVTIRLKDGQGVLIDMGVTDGSGNYSFPDLPDGSYTVEEINPPRTTGGSDAAVPGNGIDTIAVTLIGAGGSAGNDFVDLRSKAVTYAGYLEDTGLVPGTGDGQLVPDGSGNGGNPDGDYRSNLLEYALCDTPNSGVKNHFGFCVELVSPATGRIEARFIRGEGVTDVIYTLQGRSSLSGAWMDVASIAAGDAAALPFTVVSNGNGTETVTYPDLGNAGVAGWTPGFGLVRLRVSLDSEPDGTPDTVVLASDGSSVVATDFTKTFGWQSTSFNAAQCASCSNPFSNKPVFTGTVNTNAGGVLDVSTSANGANLGGVISAGGTHYLQLTSGPREGERFDIASVGVNTMTLVNDPGLFAALDGVKSLNTSAGVPASGELDGARFQVLPHRTMNQMFDKAGAFAGLASSNPSTAAKVLLYNNRLETPAFETYLLVDTGSEVKWVRSNDLGALNNQGSRRIDRTEGGYIHPMLGGLSWCVVGMVADHDVATSFNAGHNLAGAPYPIDQALADADPGPGIAGRNMGVATGFVGGVTPTTSAQIFFWLGDRAVDVGGAYGTGYSTRMLLNGGGMQRWINANDPTIQDLGGQILLPRQRAASVKLPTANTLKPHIYPEPAS